MTRKTGNVKPETETFPLRIEEVAFGGAGVGRRDGKVVFVPFTIVGELVTVRLIEDRRTLSRGVLCAVSEVSPHRQEPRCPYFGECGGCDYQHVAYPHQLEIKQRQVEQLITRIAGISHPPVAQVVPSPRIFGYRNRITVHSDKNALGLFARNSRSVIDIATCPIASPAVNELLTEQRGGPRGDQQHYTLREHKAQRTFSQTNDAVAGLLRDYVVAQATGPIVVDAFSGDGFFAHALAKHVDRVVGIEWNRPAVERAHRMAGLNEGYLCADVNKALPGALRRNQPGTLILDPPRAGLNPQILRTINDHPPPRVIYVSCNPPVLARDLKSLQSRYAMREIQPFDMFPQTAEIEAVAILERT